LLSKADDADPSTKTSVDESQIAHLLNARRVRRMSDYVKLSLAAAVLCLRDAGVAENAAFIESCAAILGTTHGSSNYSETYYRQIVQEGIAAANPMLFAEGVPNAAAAHLSLMLSLKGPCQTIIGTRTAGLDALRLAHARISCGQWERALVGAAEEYGPLLAAIYRHFARQQGNDDGGFVAGSGAVTLLLENRRSMESHGGRALGRVIQCASARGEPRFLALSVRSIWRQLGKLPSPVLGGRVAECFSVLPLARIAAGLLSEPLPASG